MDKNNQGKNSLESLLLHPIRIQVAALINPDERSGGGDAWETSLNEEIHVDFEIGGEEACQGQTANEGPVFSEIREANANSGEIEISDGNASGQHVSIEIETEEEQRDDPSGFGQGMALLVQPLKNIETLMKGCKTGNNKSITGGGNPTTRNIIDENASGGSSNERNVERVESGENSVTSGSGESDNMENSTTGVRDANRENTAEQDVCIEVETEGDDPSGNNNTFALLVQPLRDIEAIMMGYNLGNTISKRIKGARAGSGGQTSLSMDGNASGGIFNATNANRENVRERNGGESSTPEGDANAENINDGNASCQYVSIEIATEEEKRDNSGGFGSGMALLVQPFKDIKTIMKGCKTGNDKSITGDGNPTIRNINDGNASEGNSNERNFEGLESRNSGKGVSGESNDRENSTTGVRDASRENANDQHISIEIETEGDDFNGYSNTFAFLLQPLKDIETIMKGPMMGITIPQKNKSARAGSGNQSSNIMDGNASGGISNATNAERENAAEGDASGENVRERNSDERNGGESSTPKEDATGESVNNGNASGQHISIEIETDEEQGDDPGRSDNEIALLLRPLRDMETILKGRKAGRTTSKKNKNRRQKHENANVNGILTIGNVSEKDSSRGNIGEIACEENGGGESVSGGISNPETNANENVNGSNVNISNTNDGQTKERINENWINITYTPGSGGGGNTSSRSEASWVNAVSSTATCVSAVGSETSGMRRRRSYTVLNFEDGGDEDEKKDKRPRWGMILMFMSFWAWVPSPFNLFWKFFKMFFDTLRLPGWKDAVADGMHLFKRICFWALAGFSFCFGIWWSARLVQYYYDNPTSTTRSSTAVAVYNTHMFSHTTCFNCNLKKSAVDAALRIYAKVTTNKQFTDKGIEWDVYSANLLLVTIYQMCHPKTTLARAFPNFAMEILAQFVANNQVSFINERNSDAYQNKVLPFIKAGQFTVDESLGACVLFGKVVDCKMVFTTRQTEMGTCFVFNGIPHSIKYKFADNLRGAFDEMEISKIEREKWENNRIDDFNFKTGRPYSASEGKRNKSLMPLFQPIAGFQYGFTYTLKFNQTESACCQKECPGFTMATYSPFEEPNLLKSGNAVSFNTETYIGVIPQITMADPEIMSIEPERRLCYNENETQFLQHFNYYSQSNCEAECEAKAIYERCECSIFLLPSGFGDVLCKPSDYECVENARADLFAEDYEDRCGHCLPACTQFTLRKEMSLSFYDPLNPPQHVYEFVGKENLHDFQTAVINVAYIEQQVPADKIAFSITTLELIGQVGGLLGLTSGWTIIDIGRLLQAFWELLFAIWLERRRRREAFEAFLQLLEEAGGNDTDDFQEEELTISTDVDDESPQLDEDEPSEDIQGQTTNLTENQSSQLPPSTCEIATQTNKTVDISDDPVSSGVGEPHQPVIREGSANPRPVIAASNVVQTFDVFHNKLREMEDRFRNILKRRHQARRNKISTQSRTKFQTVSRKVGKISLILEKRLRMNRSGTSLPNSYYLYRERNYLNNIVGKRICKRSKIPVYQGIRKK